MPKASRKNGPGRAPATADYEAKTSHEAARREERAARSPARTGAGPFGDPLSGVVLVAEVAEGLPARMADALCRSLAAVGLEEAYVTLPGPYLLEELLSLEPSALIAVGPDAARAIDSVGYPLAKRRFSDSPEGSWFAWSGGASGLKLPALAPALDDEEAKRRFWRAFLSLRVLAPTGDPNEDHDGSPNGGSYRP